MGKFLDFFEARSERGISQEDAALLSARLGLVISRVEHHRHTLGQEFPELISAAVGKVVTESEQVEAAPVVQQHGAEVVELAAQRARAAIENAFEVVEGAREAA